MHRHCSVSELHEIFSRVWQDLLARPSGPFALRFVLQPLMAIALAVRDGRADARAGRPPYFWALLREPGQRARRVQEGLAALSRVIVLALALDALYQASVLGTIHPGELILVALALAFAPYLLARGPAGRIARKYRRIRAQP